MIKVYVSSTFQDLEQHRKHVCEQLRKMGYLDVAMEHYSASDQRPVDKCLADVRDCDVYLGIFAHRYGHIPNGSTKSITELEFREAVKSNKPRLIFVLPENAAWPLSLCDAMSAAGGERIRAFRAELLEDHTVDHHWTTPEELVLAVDRALHRWSESARSSPKKATTALPPPEKFKILLEKKRQHFCGRQWVFDAIDDWLRDDNAMAALLVTGDPGAGKSALLSAWNHRNGERVLACHCCEALMNDQLRPGRFVLNVAAQIAEQLPEYARLVVEDQGLERWKSEESCQNDPIQAFRALVLERLRVLTPPDNSVRVLLVDALDEALALKDAKSKTIVDVLACTTEWFPEWLRLIATTRREKDILKKFTARNELPLTAKHDKTLHEKNLDDVALYINTRLKEPKLSERLAGSKITPFDLSRTLVDKSDGNFLYVQQALEGIKSGIFQVDRLDLLPPGLNSLYLRWFQWQFPDEAAYAPVRQLLEVVVAACAPLGKAQLAEATGLDADDQLPPVLARLSAYVPERSGTYGLYHQSLGEWLTGPELAEDSGTPRYFISRKRGHRRLADYGWQLFNKSSTRLPPYFQRYLPEHLVQTERWEDLARLLTDLGLLEQIRKQGQSFAWMQHFQTLRKSFSCEPAQAFGEQLQALIKREGETERVSEMADLVGCFLCDMGEYTAAQPFTERALELSEKLLGCEHPETATRMHNLGELYRLTRQHAKALPLLQEALRQRELFAVDGRDLAATWHKLGEFHHDLGEANVLSNAHHFEALKYYEQALEICERTLDENHHNRADCIHDIGVAHMQLGERAKLAGDSARAEPFFNKALSQFDQARAIFDTIYGVENPESATADLNCAIIYANMGNLAAANEIGTNALAQLRKTLSENHYKIRLALSHVGDFQRRAGQWSECVANFQEELRLARLLLGPEAVERILIKLASAYAASGNVGQGMAHLRAHGKTLSAQDRPRLGEFFAEAARTCTSWGVAAPALPFAEEALKVHEECCGADSVEVANSLAMLGKLQEAAGQIDQAESSYLRFLKMCEPSAAADPAALLPTLRFLKNFYDKRLRFERGAAIGERIVAIYEKAPATDTSDRAAALNNLGFSLVRIGRFAEARDRLIQSLDLYHEAQDNDTSANLNNLAEAHLGLGNLQDAETCCRQALDIREKAAAPKSLAISLTTWASISAARADFDGAEESFCLALKNHEHAGNDACPFHFETLARYAAFLRERGKESEAQSVREQAESQRARLTGTRVAANATRPAAGVPS